MRLLIFKQASKKKIVIKLLETFERFWNFKWLVAKNKIDIKIVLEFT
jgi:hypothetical protein